MKWRNDYGKDMQINEATLAYGLKAAKPLSGQDYFRADDDLFDLLLRTLIKHAADSKHLDRMIHTWVGSTREALHPSDVPNLADRTADRPGIPAPCDDCKKTDWPLIVIRAGISGAGRCTCDRGKRLDASDREHSQRPWIPQTEERQLTMFDLSNELEQRIK